MNKVYRTVFNEKTNTWVAVAETAKAHGKSASGSVHGIAVGLLERVGIKIPRFAASTMLLVLTAAGYAHAGPGIYINDGQDVNCTVLPDGSTAVPYAIQPGNPQQVSTPLQGVGNVSMYNAADVGLTSSYNPCNSRTTASSEAHDKQTNRTLFYGDKNHTASETENGAKNLTLGGRLDVNSGIIGLGDRGTNGTNATNSIRIGTGVTLDDANKQTNSIAIGVDTMATEASAMALGAKAKAQLENSVALGSGSTTGVHASGVESATIGSVTYGGGANKFAGSTNIAAGDQVSIGSANNERQIKHVAAGAITASSTDAINGSQLFYVTQGLQNQIGAASTHYYSVKDTGSESSATSNYNNNGATGNWSLAAGVWSKATADDATAVGGKKAKALAKQSLAVGSDTKAEGVSSIAIGGDDLKFLKQASIDYYKVLTGDAGFHKDTFIDTHAKGEAAVAMGVQAQATGDWSMTLGVKSETDAKSAVALGTGAKGKAEGVVALGAGSVADREARAAGATTSSTATVATGDVYANANASNDAKKAVSATVKQVAGAPLGAVSVGNADNTRQITHVAAGTEDSDAVNVAQLKAVAEATATTPLLVGDGTGNNPAGKVIAPAAGNENKLATAGDIANAINNSGFQATAGGNLASGSTATATTVKPGQKVTFAAGDGLTVKQEVDANGDQSYTYAVNAQTVVQNAQTPVVYTKADGSKVYKHTDGNFYTQPNGAGTQVPVGDVIASMRNADGTTTTPTTLANVNAGTKGTDAVNVSQLKGAAAALGGGAGVNTDGTFKAPSYTIAKTDGTTYAAADNVGTALSNLNTEVIKPLTFAGDSGTNVERKLGSTVNVKGGVTDAAKLSDNNIGVVANGTDGLNVKLAKELKGLTSAGFKDAAGNTTTVGGNGITIAAPTTGNPTNKVSLSSGGLNNGGNKISNVAAGTDDTDAVNKGQLNSAIKDNKTHYYSVKDTGSESSATSNYNNNGATGNWSLAAGVWSKATADDATAVGGKKAKALAKQSLAVGSDTKAEGVSSIAIGGDDLKFLKQASIDYYKVLTGDAGFHKDTFIDTHAKGEAAVAMGVQAQATGDWSMTLGVKSETDAKSAVALGTGAKGKAEGVVALGAGSVADREARAAGATTSSTATVATGDVYANANASNDAKKAVSATVKQVAGAPLGAVSVGNADNTRQITHVAAGTEDSDAVNVAQLKAVAEATATTPLLVGDGTGNNPAGKVIAPAAGNENKLATAGDIANAINNSGFQATAGGNLASGSTATATTVKPGQKVTFAAGDGLTVKQEVDANGDQSYTYAVNAQTVVQNAQTPVVYTKADGSKVYKHTDGNFYTQPNGAGTQVPVGDVIASMRNADGTTTTPTTLANVNAGTKGTDAVNVSQLKGAAAALGGGAGVNTDGTFKAPSYTIAKTDGTTYAAADNVGTALSNLNTEVIKPLTFAGDSGTNVERKLGSTVNVKGGVTDAAKLSDNNIGVVANGTDGLNVKLAKELKGLTSAGFKDAAGNTTTVGGNGVTITPKAAGRKPVSLTSNGLNNGGNKITNVAPGTADTDAVNVSQLNQAAAKAANKVEAGSNIVVTPTQNKDGSTTYKVATANDLKANSFTAGGVSLSAKGINAGNKAITNVAAGVNNTDAANVGQVKAAKTEVKAGTNIASVVETKGSNGQSIYTVNADGASVSAGSTALTVTKGKKNANNVTDYAVDLSAKTKADIAKGAAAKDALDTKGLTFTGDTGTTGVKKLGSQVAVTGDSNITTKADASGVNVALKRDLNVDSVTAGNTTVNNGGVTIKSPTIGNPNNTVNLTANGLSNGGKQITNVASGLNGRTVAQIKAEGSKAAEWNNAATVGDLTQVENNVTNISNNYSKTFGGDNNQYVDNTGKLTPAGKVALKTYNVSGQKEYVNNSVISAIKNMNEQGIKFFHVNDGQTQIDQVTNTEDSSASGRYAVAIGYQAEGNGVDAVAMGSQSVASGQNGIAIGKGAQAAGKNSISIGTGNKVSGANSGAFGAPTIMDGANSYSVGNNNTVATDNTFVLGNNVTATKANSAFLGNKSGSFSQTGATTDATTGVHKAVSGSSNYTYLGANDANVAGVSDAVGIVSVGNASETRQVQGVAAGVISANSTDAINGSQLYYTNQAINQNINNQVVNMGNQLNQKIDDVAADSKAGTAAAMAVAGLPQAYLPGKSMMAVGGSVYRGESGYAIGYSTISDGGNWIVKGTATGNSRGHYGATVAVGYQW